MLKLAALFDIVGYETGLTFYRIHDQQVTIGQLDWAAMLIERNQINSIILNDPNCPLSAAERQIVKRNLKNLLVRNLFHRLFKNGLRETKSVYESTALTPRDCWLALMPNKKIGS